MPDHVHLVLSIPPAVSVSDVVGRIKGATSRSLNEQLGGGFGWQAEYGVVSFAERQLPAVIAYVTNQRQHHADDDLTDGLERIDEPA